MANLTPFVRQDLVAIGLPDRTIRILEQAALLTEAINRIALNEEQITDLDEATDAINEVLEDAAVTLETLDERLDEQENGNGPYVKKAGDVMTGDLDVHGLVQCDTLRIDTAPAAAAAVPSTHTVAVNLNGTVYYLLASNV